LQLMWHLLSDLFLPAFELPSAQTLQPFQYAWRQFAWWPGCLSHRFNRL
jgi:hypothetical protein